MENSHLPNQPVPPIQPAAPMPQPVGSPMATPTVPPMSPHVSPSTTPVVPPSPTVAPPASTPPTPPTPPAPAASATVKTASHSGSWLWIVLILLAIVVSGGIGFLIGRSSVSVAETSLTQLEGGPEVWVDTPELQVEEVPVTEATTAPVALDTQYTSDTISFSYPADWTMVNSNVNPDYFTEKGIIDFDHKLMLEKDGYYLFIGTDDTPAVEVDGVFSSEAMYQEFVNKRTAIQIGADLFYLNNADTALSALTDPNRSAGIFGIASLSEFQPNKVSGEQGMLNGFSDFIKKNGKGYLFIKLSDMGNEVTPQPIQSELVAILGTIQW